MSRKRKQDSAAAEMTDIATATEQAESNGKPKRAREVRYLLMGYKIGAQLLTLIREFKTRKQFEKYVESIGPVIQELYTGMVLFKGRFVNLADKPADVPQG